jgi:hypothetical protein
LHSKPPIQRRRDGERKRRSEEIPSSLRLSVSTSLRLFFGLLVCLLIFGPLSACQTAQVKSPVTLKYSNNDPDTQLNFWHELADRKVTCNDDAFHALLLYIDAKDDAKNYDQRVSSLKSRGLLPDSFNQPANFAVSRGVLAVAIVKYAGIKGGWVMHVFGPSPRYAVKELVYDGIFPPSSPQQTFSGSEFVGIIGALEDYQRPSTAD